MDLEMNTLASVVKNPYLDNLGSKIQVLFPFEPAVDFERKYPSELIGKISQKEHFMVLEGLEDILITRHQMTANQYDFSILGVSLVGLVIILASILGAPSITVGYIGMTVGLLWFFLTYFFIMRRYFWHVKCFRDSEKDEEEERGINEFLEGCQRQFRGRGVTFEYKTDAVHPLRNTSARALEIYLETQQN